MRLSSVMFFSFSSAMVMFTCNKGGMCVRECGGEVLQGKTGREFKSTAAQAALQASPKFIWSYRNAGKEQLPWGKLPLETVA
jgi:hypothetical protein